MAKLPGLKRRPSGTYYLDKTIKGRRYVRSPRPATRDRGLAEEWYHRVVGDLFKAVNFGDRPNRTFVDAVEEFARRATHKTLTDDLHRLAVVCEAYGDVPLDRLWAIDDLVDQLQDRGLTNKTVNAYLENVQRVLNQATRWRDDTGLTWLATAPKLDRLPNDSRKPMVLSWAQEREHLDKLPSHLLRMAQFILVTGLRDQEVCGLKWEWLHPVEANSPAYFEIPGAVRKNGEVHRVLINQTAGEMLDWAKDDGPVGEYVFTYEGARITRMTNTAWTKWRDRHVPGLRVHDLRHTVGHRLRAVGCPLEDRKDILGHHRGDITERYSAPDLRRLKGWLDQIQSEPGPVVLREVV